MPLGQRLAQQFCYALLFALMVVAPSAFAQNFDHRHRAWDTLLQKHVRLIDPYSSRVAYGCFQQERAPLKAYLQTLSAVTADQYASWAPAQQFAFLANAYNAFTIEKVLQRYPNLNSIRDFGRVFGNPWKDRFFYLLGQSQNLDGIEHQLLRASGVFDEPRVHVALNCASISCPMLLNRALIADELNAQLDDLWRRFLSDPKRNRYNSKQKVLELSAIFDWYRTDFVGNRTSFLGFRCFDSLQGLSARYAHLFTSSLAEQAQLRQEQVPVRFLEYDWGLNSTL